MKRPYKLTGSTIEQAQTLLAFVRKVEAEQRPGAGDAIAGYFYLDGVKLMQGLLDEIAAFKARVQAAHETADGYAAFVLLDDLMQKWGLHKGV